MLDSSLMIIVGDSRVKHLRDAWPGLTGWEARWLYKSGATLTNCLSLLGQAKNDNGDESPSLIFIVGILCEALSKTKDENGNKILVINPKVDEDKMYPGLSYFQRTVVATNRQILSWWPHTKVVWVNPFPVDVARYNGLGQNLTPSKHLEHQVTSYRFSEYLQQTHGILSKVLNHDNYIPWFVMWRKEEQYGGVSYDVFRRMTENQKTVEHIVPEGSVDGLHPNFRSSRALLRAMIRKANEVAPPKIKPAPVVEKRRRVPAFPFKPVELAVKESSTEKKSPSVRPKERRDIPVEETKTESVTTDDASVVIEEENLSSLVPVEDRHQSFEMSSWCAVLDTSLSARYEEPVDTTPQVTECNPKEVTEVKKPVPQLGDPWLGAALEEPRPKLDFIDSHFTEYPCGHRTPTALNVWGTAPISCGICGETFSLAYEDGSNKNGFEIVWYQVNHLVLRKKK